MPTIYHLVGRDEWEKAETAGVYRPDSLESDGFIHAGYRSQVLDVANLLFHGEPDLVLLCIDPDRVTAEIREDLVEFPEGRESLHPHFYGPLNTGAVFRVLDFPPQADGSFVLPPDLPA